jgi:hypothetical protein
MLLRLIHALFGAVLGVAIPFWIFDGFNWTLISICSGICGVLAFVWGESFLQWLKWWD